MKSINPDIKRSTLLFASRFGFITRDLFFEHFCKLSRSQQYLIWKMLIDERWIIPHGSGCQSGYLSTKARREFAPKAVPARSHYFIEHDLMAAKLTLALEGLGVVAQFWTERELSIFPWETYSVLGCNSLDKIPDLIVDLRGAYGRLRIAVEIERTRKAKVRYDQAALSYLSMKNVDLVIYGCRFRETAKQVRSAFQGEAFKKAHKIPAVYLTDDFERERLNAQIRYQGQSYRLVDFLSLALKLDLTGKQMDSSDGHRTTVRWNEDKRKEAV